MKTLFAFLSLLQLSMLSHAHADIAASHQDTFEDGPEFDQPFYDSTTSMPDDMHGDTGEQLDPSLENTGTWGYLVTYVSHAGLAQDLATYRATQKIKPASTMKLFTGWMAFLTEAQPVDFLSHMLRVSDNNQAEATLKKMGGIPKLVEFYNHQNLPLAAENFNGVDGSGLSHSNKVTAKLEVDLLTQIYIGGNYDVFKRLLAQPSEYSTLRQEGRFQDFAYPLYAKTGTLKETASLAGYVELNHGTLLFSILSNDLKPKSVVSYVTRYVKKNGKRQKVAAKVTTDIRVKNARKLIDAMVVKYAEKAQSL